MEREEAALVFPLLLHNFFLGVGIAFLFTTSSAIFIYEFEGAALALAFVVAGMLMMGTAQVYSHFEHKIELERFLPFVVLVLMGLVLGVRLSGYAMSHAVVAFAMLVAYRIVYMLANLEFWGLTSLVFNIRQSKRLFGLIGSGDIPAKMLGYFSVSLLSKKVAPEELLYVSVAAFLLAFFSLVRVLRNPAARARLHQHRHHHHGHVKGHSRDSFLKKIFGNQFILALAAFAIMSSMAMGVVDFSFYGKVKHQYKSSHELAAFLGYFMTLSMAVTFALKLLFSGKLLQRVGVSAVLVFLPIVLLLPSLFLLIPIPLNADHKLLLWFFSVMYLVRDVCKYALVDPMFLALFQPLNSHLRLKGHTLIKGWVDPLGLAAIGALIFLGEKVAEEGMFKLLAAGLAIICLAWIVSVRHLGKEWLELLRSSVRKRFLDGHSVSIGGKVTADLLLSRLDSDQPSEAIYALRLLEENTYVSYPEVLLSALEKPWPELQLFALERLAQLDVPVPQETLERITHTTHHQQLQMLAVKLLLSTGNGHSKFNSFAEHHSDAVRQGAIAGMLVSMDPSARTRGNSHLNALLDSHHPQDNYLGLCLVAETEPAVDHATVQRLLTHDSTLVVQGAIRAAGRLVRPEYLSQLLSLTAKPAHRSTATEALANYDIQEIIHHAEGNHAILRTLCRMAGRPNSGISNEFLIEQLASQDASLRRDAIIALMKRGFKAKQDSRIAELISQMQQQLFAAHAEHEAFLTMQDGKALAHALETELHDMVDQLLICLSFKYDARTMMRVRHGLRFKNQELRADALEILDHLLPRGQASRLLHLLEVLYLDRARKPASHTHPTTLLKGCERLMKEASSMHDAWTICLATDHYLKLQPHPVSDLVEAAVAASTPFLSKYAQWLHNRRPDVLSSPSMSVHQENDTTFSPLEMVLMLKSSKIFSETPENTLAEVAAIAVVERVAEGDILFKKGDPGDCMYIIAEGEVAIADGSTVFATLRKSDFFGELALVETEPRSADAIAAADCLLIRIGQDDFYELIEDRTEVARGILVILAQRLRRQNELIRQLKESGG